MRILLLSLFLIVPVSLHAQTLPDAPKPKPDRRAFLAGITLLAASKTADAITTRQLLDRGGWENNPIFGRYPTPAHQAGINAAFFVGQAAIFAYTEHNRRAWIRWIGRTYIGVVISNHVEMAACNSQVDPHAHRLQNCRPFLPL